MAIKWLVNVFHARCPAIRLKPEAIILEAGAGAFMEANVVFVKERFTVDARPILHADVEQARHDLRVENLVIQGMIVMAD